MTDVFQNPRHSLGKIILLHLKSNFKKLEVQEVTYSSMSYCTHK